MELISIHSVHCEMCFNPRQQVRDWRAGSQLQLIDWPLIVGIQDFTHGRKMQLPGRLRTALRVSISRRPTDRWLRTETARKDGRKAAFFSFARLENVSQMQNGLGSWAEALVKLFPLGCSFHSKDNWLPDLAKIHYQQASVWITDANIDTKSQRHKSMLRGVSVMLQQQYSVSW